MFTKTALKKIKKPDIIDLYLGLQARVFDDKMDEDRWRYQAHRKLQAKNEDQSSIIEKLEKRLANLEKDITLHPDYETLVKLIEENSKNN